MDSLEARADRLECSSRALVQSVGLDLDPPAAERLERVLELEQLRLDVGAGSPGRRVQPGPSNLDGAVLRLQGEEARRAHDLFPFDRDERDLRPRLGCVERLQHPGRPLLPRTRLDDAEPAPRAVVLGGEPEPLLVRAREWFEPDDPPLQHRTCPTLHRARDSTLGTCPSMSTRAWGASRISTSSCAAQIRPSLAPNAGVGTSSSSSPLSPSTAPRSSRASPGRAEPAVAAAAVPAAAVTDRRGVCLTVRGRAYT